MKYKRWTIEEEDYIKENYIEDAISTAINIVREKEIDLYE